MPIEVAKRKGSKMGWFKKQGTLVKIIVAGVVVSIFLCVCIAGLAVIIGGEQKTTLEPTKTELVATLTATPTATPYCTQARPKATLKLTPTNTPIPTRKVAATPTPSPVPTHTPTLSPSPIHTPTVTPDSAMTQYWTKVKPLVQQFEVILARELPQVGRAVELEDPGLLCQIPLEDVIDIIHRWPYDYEGPPEAKEFDLHFYWAIEDWEMVQDCIQLYCQTGKAQYLQELATHVNNCRENLDRASELLIKVRGK